MIKLLFLFLCVSMALAGPGTKIYGFGELSMAFEEIDGFIVNRACKGGCLALKKAKEFKKQAPDSALLTGGKNPRAVKCKSVLKGKVVIGRDLRGNEQSFCRFEDHSYVSVGSI